MDLADSKVLTFFFLKKKKKTRTRTPNNIFYPSIFLKIEKTKLFPIGYSHNKVIMIYLLYIQWEGKFETVSVVLIRKVLVMVWGHWREWRTDVSVWETACTGERVLRGCWWKMKDASSLRLEEQVTKKGLRGIGLWRWNEGFLRQRGKRVSNATVDMVCFAMQANEKKKKRRRRNEGSYIGFVLQLKIINKEWTRVLLSLLR